MCLPAGWTGEGKIAQEAKPCIRNKHTYSKITSHAVAGYGLLEEDFLSRRSSSCLWGLPVWASQVLSDNESRSHSTKCLLLVLAREPSFLAGVCWLLSRGAVSASGCQLVGNFWMIPCCQPWPEQKPLQLGTHLGIFSPKPGAISFPDPLTRSGWQ